MMNINKNKIGVAIASIIIICFCLLIGYISKYLYGFENQTVEEKGRHDQFAEIEILVLRSIVGISVFAIIITGLLIVGIIKKNSKLISLWLCCSSMGIICQCLSIILGFHLLNAFFPLLITQLLVFWFMYTILRDIWHVPEELNADNNQPMLKCRQPNYV